MEPGNFIKMQNVNIPEKARGIGIGKGEGEGEE